MTDRSAQASAPGKVILFGEHAVVYGQPAIAVPVSEVEARARVDPAPTGSGLTLVAADLGESLTLAASPRDDPLVVAARLTLEYVMASPPDATVTIESSIPIASGLGSGAAVSTALVRALADFLGCSLAPEEISDLVYEVEKIHHGTPSGIDNTVIAHERPVYFVRGATSGPELLTVGTRFRLLVADTGLPSPTKCLVRQVREAWERETGRYEALFSRIGDAAREARVRMENGDVDALGPLMDENHRLLIDLGVSSEVLDRLVEVARAAGASGAKLSGAGQGGNMVTLVDAESLDAVHAALQEAGVARTVRTTVG